MITASLGSHRFEAGPTYHYNASDVGQLVATMMLPESTTDYVNELSGVNATNEEVRQVAAAGIVRLAVAQAKYSLVYEATRVLLGVCGGEVGTVAEDLLKGTYKGDDLRRKIDGKLSNALLDSASVLATRKNKPTETAAVIEEQIDVDGNLFVIGLANGGIISAAHTFLELEEGDHALSFVRYSRRKSGDEVPDMYPYPEERIEALKREALGRQVVVYDEDYCTEQTLRTAVGYFAELFEKPVVGIAPVEVERRITYNPLVVKA